jgi:hypothetical protein
MWHGGVASSGGTRQTGGEYSRQRAAVIRLPHIDMVRPRESVGLGDRLVIRRQTICGASLDVLNV